MTQSSSVRVQPFPAPQSSRNFLQHLHLLLTSHSSTYSPTHPLYVHPRTCSTVHASMRISVFSFPPPIAHLPAFLCITSIRRSEKHYCPSPQTHHRQQLSRNFHFSQPPGAGKAPPKPRTRCSQKEAVTGNS